MSMSAQCVAQTFPNLLFVNSAGGNAADVGNAVYSDKYGNTYVTGIFGTAADFDSSPGTANLFTAGGGDVFLVKYNSLGQYVWAINFGSSGWDYGYEICGDSANNIYVTGRIAGTTDFDPGAGTATITPVGGDDVFVAKYNSNGQYQWAFNIGSVNQDIGMGIKTDALNNVYVCGRVSGVADFDPSAAVAISSVTTGMFLAKYNSNGQYQWAFNLKNVYTGNYHPLAVDVDGNSYIATAFSDTVDFDPSPSTYTLAAMSASGGNGCIASYNNTGQYRWAGAIGGTSGMVFMNGIAVDSSRNVYISGHLQGTIDTDPSGSTNTLTALGTQDILVGKYDKNGQHLWSFNLGVSGLGGNGMGISTDLTGNIYLGGLLSGADFDPSPGVAAIMPVGSNDGFLAKYNTQGQYQYAFNIGGSSSEGTFATCTDLFGNVTVCGNFQSSNVDFDPNSPVINAPYVTFSDYFVAKYGLCSSPNAPVNTSVNTSICSGKTTTLSVNGTGNIYWYASPTSTTSLAFGTTYVTPVLSSSTTATTYTYYAGVTTCTSSPRTLVTVTVNPLPLVSIVTSSTLMCTGESATLTATGANTYTWSTGDTGSAIAISPAVTSNYTVVGTDINGCIKNTVLTQSVSLCTGVEQLEELGHLIHIFPNPNSGAFKIENVTNELEFIIINNLGEKVHQQQISHELNSVVTTVLAKGLYFYMILQNEERIYSGNLVIE